MIGKHLKPFAFWCQKVLPTVYDDSLSYYEYLCKLNNYLNEVIEQINTLTTEMEDYEEDLNSQWNTYKTNLNGEWLDYKTELNRQWNETKDWITNYFNNLDVQQEINNKLDAMALDGTLSTLLAPIVGTQIGGVVAEQIGGTVANQIDSVVASQIGNVVAGQIDEPVASATATWLAEHIEPTTPTIDNTLLVSGSGADAQKTGEDFATQYSSLVTYKKGDIVLNNGNIYKCIVDINVAESWTSSKWRKINLGNEDVLQNNIETADMTMLRNIANGEGIITFNNIAISNVDSEYYQGSTGALSSFAGFDCVTFDVSENTRYYVGTCYGYSNSWGINYFNGSTFISADIHPYDDTLRFFEGEIITPVGCNKIRLQREHDITHQYKQCYVQIIGAFSKCNEYKDITNDVTWEDNAIRNVENQTAYTFNGLRNTIIDVKANEKYYVIGTKFYNYYPYVLLNNRDNVIGYGNLANDVMYGFFDITIPHNACKLVVNGVMEIGSTAGNTDPIFTKGFIPSRIYKRVDKTVVPKIKPQKITFMGDSITDDGTLNGTWGAEPNYTSFVSEALGLTKSNKAVSGSGWRASHDINMSFMDVASRIDTDSDIVTICGSWNDGTSNIGTLGDGDITTIYGACEQTIINLIARVPNARIGIISPTPWAIANPYNVTNDLKAYCKALQDVAYKYSIPYLDLFSCSSLRPWDTTFKNGFYKDADGTHPSSEAHRRFIAPKVIEFVRQLMQQN